MSPDPDHFQSLAGFRYALRRFLAASEQISRGSDVTPQQYQAMLAIAAWGDRPMTMKDLAEQLLLTHHAAVQLTNRLVHAGLAARTPSTVDRRRVVLTLTEGGATLVTALAAQHLQEILRQEPLLTKSLAGLRQAARSAPTKKS